MVNSSQCIKVNRSLHLRLRGLRRQPRLPMLPSRKGWHMSRPVVSVMQGLQYPSSEHEHLSPQ